MSVLSVLGDCLAKIVAYILECSVILALGVESVVLGYDVRRLFIV